MELKPLTIEAIFHRLSDQAAKRMTTVILQARIAVTPSMARPRESCSMRF